MIVGSVCSGIEAASQAAPKNWEFAFFSEIENFPSATLKYHYPNIPNLGDMRNIKAENWRNVTMLCGGPPCQSFSIAGQRAGLNDERGNLTLDYVRMCHEFADDGSLLWALYENVPGILSDKTNAFGCLLSGLVGGHDPLLPPEREWGFIHDSLWFDVGWDEDGDPIRKEAATCGGAYGWKSIRWPSQGMVEGPRARAAWDILDAQWFGVAQRRKRVFVVISFADDRDPAKILFERKGVFGNTPPSRESGEGFAADVRGGAKSSREVSIIDRAAFNQGSNALYDPKIGIEETMPSLVARGPRAVGHEVDLPQSETVGALTDGAHNGGGLNGQDAYTGRIFPVAFSSKNNGQDAISELSPTLRAGSHDKSHANAGAPPAVAFKPSHYKRGKDGKPSEIAPRLTADADKGDQEAVVCAPKITGAVEDTAHPLTARVGDSASRVPQEQGALIPMVQGPFTMSVRGRGDTSNFECRQDGTANCLLTPNGGRAGVGVGAVAFKERGGKSGGGKGYLGKEKTAFTISTTHDQNVFFNYAVRRLTPVECEILQGFPPNFTMIPWGNPPKDDFVLSDDIRDYAIGMGLDPSDPETKHRLCCPDGPRYKALGNSWAVPVVAWIFNRIEQHEVELRLSA